MEELSFPQANPQCSDLSPTRAPKALLPRKAHSSRVIVSVNMADAIFDTFRADAASGSLMLSRFQP
jgi:hypothetical protein